MLLSDTLLVLSTTRFYFKSASVIKVNSSQVETSLQVCSDAFCEITTTIRLTVILLHKSGATNDITLHRHGNYTYITCDDDIGFDCVERRLQDALNMKYYQLSLTRRVDIGTHVRVLLHIIILTRLSNRTPVNVVPQTAIRRTMSRRRGYNNNSSSHNSNNNNMTANN